MFALAMADGKKKVCRWSVVCRGKFGEWVKRPVGGVWSVGVKRASGSKKLSLACGLSWRKGRVGQEACRWSVVCRGEKGEWVKEIVGGVWAECGLSWRKGRVGQRNCRWRVVCRGEKGEWVKRIVASVWSVVASLASGSKGLSAECGLSGQVWRVGQKACQRSVVCRGEKGEWVKRPVAGMWSVVAKRASGSRGLSLECGLSARKGRVGQEACRWSVVWRGEKGEWVKRIVGGVWSDGAKTASGSRRPAA